MNKAYTIYHIARADFLERTRRYSFLITIALTMFAAYLFVPPVDANYVTFYLGDYRGIYNSAWIGGIVAISTTMFLSLFGFYLVKNSIDRDAHTRVGYIIAGTSLKKFHYLLGKAISNFAVLTVIVFLTMLVALLMQLVRGEEQTINLWALVSPFLIIVIPQMAVVAALAIVFESWSALRGVTGNIIFLVLFIAFTSTTLYSNISTDIISGQMRSDLKLVDSAYDGTYGQGVLFLDNPLKTFQWDGMQWSGSVITMQLLFFVAAFVLCLFATLLFRGFAEMPIAQKGMGRSKSEQDGQNKKKHKKQKKNQELDQQEELKEEFTTTEDKSLLIEADEQVMEAVPAVSPSFSSAQLTPIVPRFRFMKLVQAELGLMLKGVPWIWYAIAAVLAILCLLLPMAASVRYFWPLAWIWPLLMWSNMGSREATHSTHMFLASSPRMIARQLPAVWIAGYLITVVTGIGMLIRLLLEGDMLHVLHWLIGSLFITTMALGLGVLTHSKKTFEVLYMLLWYVGPINKVPVLDFLGTDLEAGSLGSVDPGFWLSVVGYFGLTIVLFVLAFVGRRRLADIR
ncbi:hypothetical protein [Paenibacillus fonticola]|uniref:hypothetical protein n=1 Tax=Paenibacillus fonticola TaxID=379896 RepID=UPI00036A11C7|nr:hypothetical protein [Paenibacillus fonticola]